ncbi:MAG: hypothetical protein JHC26_07505 [Thermofilum sp.]|jgi:hypothetical protein|uniref:hypothetical protein n=1 Tax=Thermofilum sp. TaxID=1961369 RepID=UPI002586727B|nr:hypothetical protein [Thermofilum sp.]MCI4408923.1 hypothetical protein [Thermofilum sp.]
MSQYTVAKFSIREADPDVARQALEKLAERHGFRPVIIEKVSIMGNRVDYYLEPLDIGVSTRNGLEVVGRDFAEELKGEYYQLYVALVLRKAAEAAGFKTVEAYEDTEDKTIEVVMVR